MMISHCDRAVWLDFRKIVTPTLTAKETLKLEINGMLKKAVINQLLSTGHTVDLIGGVLCDEYNNNVGKIDGIISKGTAHELLMILPMSGSYYKSTMKNGIPEHHHAKAQAFMYWSSQLSVNNNSLSVCNVIIFNRDTLDMYGSEIIYDETFAKDQMERMHSIITSDEMPGADKSWKCKLCKFNIFCNSGELPRITCSTCANGSYNSGQLSCSFGDELCDNHLIHPQVMASIGYPIISVNAEQRSCDYGEFVMGPKGFKDKIKKTFTSQEFIDLFEVKPTEEKPND